VRFDPHNEEGGGRNGQRMRCGAQDIDSMADEVRAVLEGGGSRKKRLGWDARGGRASWAIWAI
jgi:hypothetical protein